MAIITTVSGGIATSTDTKTGKVTTSSVYGSSPSSSPGVEYQKTAQGQTVTIRRAGSTSKPKLTESQLASESQRISEEIEKYGYYTPLEQGGDEYYQTAPELSPSRYIQTPDSAEGRRIISRHPAGELAYEGSAQWITPTQAEAKMRAGIASGEYTTQQVGYKKEIGVKGEGGVAYYGEDVLLNSLIGKKELKGVGVSPKQKELQTGSIIADMVFEGYVKPPKSTEKGFELQFTEAGQQVKPFLLSQLNKVVPDYWLLRGTNEKLMFSGMPYTITTTKVGGKTTKVTTDFYGKETERVIEINPVAGASLVVSGGEPIGEQQVYDYDVGMFRNYPGYMFPLAPYEVPVSSAPAVRAPDIRYAIKVPNLDEPAIKIRVPGKRITDVEREKRALYESITRTDRALEQLYSPMERPFGSGGKDLGSAYGAKGAEGLVLEFANIGARGLSDVLENVGKLAPRVGFVFEVSKTEYAVSPLTGKNPFTGAQPTAKATAVQTASLEQAPAMGAVVALSLLTAGTGGVGAGAASASSPLVSSIMTGSVVGAFVGLRSIAGYPGEPSVLEGGKPYPLLESGIETAYSLKGYQIMFEGAQAIGSEVGKFVKFPKPDRVVSIPEYQKVKYFQRGSKVSPTTSGLYSPEEIKKGVTFEQISREKSMGLIKEKYFEEYLGNRLVPTVDMDRLPVRVVDVSKLPPGVRTPKLTFDEYGKPITQKWKGEFIPGTGVMRQYTAQAYKPPATTSIPYVAVATLTPRQLEARTKIDKEMVAMWETPKETSIRIPQYQAQAFKQTSSKQAGLLVPSSIFFIPEVVKKEAMATQREDDMLAINEAIARDAANPSYLIKKVGFQKFREMQRRAQRQARLQGVGVGFYSGVVQGNAKGLKALQATSTATAMGVATLTGVGLGIGVATATAQATAQATVQGRIEIPDIPIVASPEFGGFAGGDGRKLPTRKKLPTKYKPSLLGVITGVRVRKAPKFVSGAEWARGIVSGGKKKGKKKRGRKK